MLAEIGSNFWDYSINNDVVNNKFFWLSSEYNKVYLKSGRNAIKALCKELCDTRKKVLLPIYTCETCIQPFVDEGWDIDYYFLNDNLTINEKSLEKICNEIKPDVIFVHSFFGFNTIRDESTLLYYKKQGTVIVEDMTQSLFSNHHLECADYFVTSFRKFLAIPDGGALISKRPLKQLLLQNADERIEEIAIRAFDMKKDYFEYQTEEKKMAFRAKYQELNELICNNENLEKIGKISEKIIFTCDIKSIKDIRVKNYKMLSSAIDGFIYLKKVIDVDINDSCPLYFPVYVNEREKLQLYLSKNSVYCPIIWKRASQIDREDSVSRYMYSHMLCFPIDQRYGEDEMKKIIKLLEEYDD